MLVNDFKKWFSDHFHGAKGCYFLTNFLQVPHMKHRLLYRPMLLLVCIKELRWKSDDSVVDFAMMPCKGWCQRLFSLSKISRQIPLIHNIWYILKFFSKYHLVTNLFHTTNSSTHRTRSWITTEHNKLGWDNYCEITRP